MDWIKCENDKKKCVWCELNKMSPLTDNAKYPGHCVFIVWHNGDKHNVLMVGQGKPEEVIIWLQKHTEIQEYKDKGLYITFAGANPHTMAERIEIYLSKTYNPRIKEDYPEELQGIEVDLPF